MLAGGHSRRFGQPDKALAALGGHALVRHAAESLVPAADELVVNCRPEQVAPIEEALADCRLAPRFALDPVPGEGPLVGLRTGLRHARGHQVAVLGCDQPLVPPALVELLFERGAGLSGAVPERDGRPQPLPGVYHRQTARDAVEATLATGSGRLLDAVDRVAPRTVPDRVVSEVAGDGALTDVNTPGDLRAAASRIDAA